MVRFAIILLAAALLSACSNSTVSPVKFQAKSKTLPACACLADEAAFIRALYHRINQDDVMPPSGKLAEASFHAGTPTFAFRHNDGAVIKFRIEDFPGRVEAYRTTALLLGAGVRAAREHGVCLNGIEVVFYQDNQRLWLVTTAVPPWGADQIRYVPLGRRGD